MSQVEDVEQDLQQAITLQQAGELEAAGTFYLSILQQQPAHAQTNYQMGLLALQMQQPGAALPYFSTALEANPGNGQYWLNYIEALLLAGEQDAAREVLSLAQQQGLQGDAVDFLTRQLSTESQTPTTQEIDSLLRLFNQGKYADALPLAHYMTQHCPQHAFGWKALGAIFKVMGRDEAALEPMRVAIKLAPDDVENQYNLGVSLQRLHQLEEAEQCYRRALQLNPFYKDALNNLGALLHEQRRYPEAESYYRRLLQLNPNHAEALNNLAATLQKMQQLQEAEQLVLQSLTLQPEQAVAYFNLGNIQRDLGKAELARHNYQRALQLNPNHAEAYYSLGVLLHQQQQLDAAAEQFLKAIQLKLNFAEAYNNLGLIRQQQGRLDEAENCLQRAISILPDYSHAHNNLGVVLQARNHLREAEASYRRAVALKPDYAQAHNNLGACLQDQSRFVEAEACFRQALQQQGDFVEALQNLSCVLREQGRLSEARVYCQRALALNPDYAEAQLQLAVLSAYMSDFADVVPATQHSQRIKPYTAENWEQHLYIYSYHPDLPAAEIYQQFEIWGDRFPAPVTQFNQHNRTLSRRLKVGYVSPDFRRHTSRFYFWPLFAHHDHSVVELYAYSNVKFADDMTGKFKTLFDHWRDIRDMSDEEAAQQIRSDGIDILVDACSHMRDDRLGVFALKPAPIQATWLGAAWTTGLKTVDYALIDPYMAPEGTLTREKIIHLPHSFVAYQPPEHTADIVAAPCLKNGFITFAYSGRTERLNHRTFRVWGEILRRLPSARLILDFSTFAKAENQQHWHSLMQQSGLDTSQVIFRKSDNIFQGLNEVDILLDSFPHSGGTMLFDALWMGIPAVTLASRPPVGRIGTTLMINLGLPEWVAQTEQEYINIACQFAAQPQHIAQLRAGMRQRMQQSPLMDGAGFALGMEAAFRDMYIAWLGKPISQTEPMPESASRASPLETQQLIQLFSQQRFAEALALAQTLVAQHPQHDFAWKALGVTFNQLGQHHESLHALLKASHLTPDDAELQNNLGNIYQDLAQYREAEQCYQRALQLNPSYAEVHSNLGTLLALTGQHQQAEQHYRQALQITPDMCEAYFNLGNVLRCVGHLADAELNYRKAIQLNPIYAAAYNNLGLALNAQGRLNEAASSYRHALEIQPNYVDAHNNLGIALKGMGQPRAAEASYRRALQLNPELAEAHSNLGLTLMDMGQLVSAQSCHRQALQIKPNYASAHQNLATISAYLSDFQEVVHESDAALQLKPDSPNSWEQRLYAFSYHPDLSAPEIYQEFVRWGDRFPDPIVDFSQHDRNPKRKLRIGYVSPDFRRHSSRFFFWPLFANHNHQQVELFAYANVLIEDEYTQEFKGLFDYWHNIKTLDDQAAAALIRADGIDILVDGCGHTRDDRLALFSLKPAPIQVTWLGAAWTSGLKMMDYALFDPYMAPEGTLTREQVVRLPHCFAVYRPPEHTANIQPAPCLKNEHITFGYCGRTERLNHHTFRVWGEILRRMPNARLILDFGPFADPPTQEHYRQFMQQHGMNPEQVEMRKSSNIFQGLNDIDISLDSFPHSGGTTLFDSLWMGVPVLTLSSRPPVGRIGTSLLMNLQLPEWIARSEADYINQACFFAEQPALLQQLRSNMRERMQSSPLMDGQQFAHDVEVAYRQMFNAWLQEGD